MFFIPRVNRMLIIYVASLITTFFIMLTFFLHKLKLSFWWVIRYQNFFYPEDQYVARYDVLFTKHRKLLLHFFSIEKSYYEVWIRLYCWCAIKTWKLDYNSRGLIAAQIKCLPPQTHGSQFHNSQIIH